MLTAASVACTWLFRFLHSIYIYMLSGLCTRVYIAIYAYIQVIYAYMELGKHIYGLYIYVFHVFLFFFMHYMCCICANGCKLLQMHALLHIICFLHNYTDLAAPLSDLLKKECTWHLTEWEQSAFEGLKTALTTAPVLMYPALTIFFLYAKDASNIAVSAVL